MAAEDAAAGVEALLDEALDAFDAEGEGADTSLAAEERLAAAAALAPAVAPDAAIGPAANAANADDGIDSELVASMESLMRGIGQVDDAELIKRLESSLAQLEQEAVAAAAATPAAELEAAPESSVERTLRLLSRSADRLSADDGGEDGGGAGADGEFGEILQQLAAGLDELGDSDEFASAIEGMMAQLVSKDVMHEPLVQLRRLFAPWMEAHAAELSASERARYEAQQEVLERILALYDAGGTEHERIIELMHEMQQHGQPPREVMRQLAPGSEVEALLRSEGDAGAKELCATM